MRPHVPPKQLPAADAAITACGSAAVYVRLIETLRDRGIGERDVERHNRFYAALADGRREEAAALVASVEDDTLRHGLFQKLRAWSESCIRFS